MRDNRHPVIHNTNEEDIDRLWLAVLEFLNITVQFLDSLDASTPVQDAKWVF